MATFNGAAAASADDGRFESVFGSAFNNSGTSISVLGANFELESADSIAFIRIPGAMVPAGAKLTLAELTLTPTTTINAAGREFSVFGSAEDNSAQIANNADAIGRAMTGSAGGIDPGSLTAGTPVVYDIDVTALQEIFVREGWVSGNALQLYVYEFSNAGLPVNYASFDHATYDPPALALTYTEGIFNDANSNSGYKAASALYSWSHTCTGVNRYLAVDVGRLSVPGTTVTGITYNGVALTQIGTTPTGTDAGRIDCWGLANPASGTNTIEVTLSAVCISAGAAVSYTGVHQTVPTEAYNGATATNVGAANALVTITSVANNDWIHAALATDDGNVSSVQTERNEVNGAGGSIANEDTGPLTPAGTQDMSYSAVGALATWTIAGYGIRPIAASGGAGLAMPVAGHHYRGMRA